jgi:hypothetical protein
MFRENLANRIWAEFFKRGIVEPVDDVRISNPPSNRELLEELGKRLVNYNFDAKRLIRDICLSRTYQLSTVPNATNRDDADQFSHQQLRRLRADVLLDSIAQATGTPTQFAGTANGFRAVQLFEGGGAANNYFLKTFGLCARSSVNAAETRLEPTLEQALHMLNGDTLEGKLARNTVVPEDLKKGDKPEEILDDLFIRALSRKPSPAEKKKLLALVTNPKDRKPYDDIFWALLSSTEFEFNH